MKNAILSISALIVLGCGGSSGTKVPNVAAYQSLLADTSAAVAKHEDASATLSAATCPAECSRYSAEVTPMLQDMNAMSPNMDGCMRDMGHPPEAQMQSTCQSMLSELNAHLAACCTVSDIAGEAKRHADAMSAMIQQEVAWAGDMQGMLNGPMMSGGTCHH